MKRELKYDTPIRIVCALLFATFSFLYIYLFQGELLALVQDHLSKGQTTNNTLVTASLITVLLMLLQHLLNRVGKLHGWFEALSYIPSCALLVLITKVDSTFSYSLVQWVITLAVVTIIFLFVVWLQRNTFEPRDAKFIRLLIPNLEVMSVLLILTGWCSNSSSVVHMELAAWKYTHSEQYAKVLNVGKHSDDCNADLTALRNFALVKTGELGNKLFFYPQLYGASGLIMNRYNVQAPSYGAKEFYRALGETPYGGESALSFYKRMMVKTDSIIYRDMFLASLLLDKDLPTFVCQTIDKEMHSASIMHSPLHYQEAWMIYNEQHPFTPVNFVPDSTVVQRYQEYLKFRETHSNNSFILIKNLCKQKFGDTYWYYYDFVD